MRVLQICLRTNCRTLLLFSYTCSLTEYLWCVGGSSLRIELKIFSKIPSSFFNIVTDLSHIMICTLTIFAWSSNLIPLFSYISKYIYYYSNLHILSQRPSKSIVFLQFLTLLHAYAFGRWYSQSQRWVHFFLCTVFRSSLPVWMSRSALVLNITKNNYDICFSINLWFVFIHLGTLSNPTHLYNSQCMFVETLSCYRLYSFGLRLLYSLCDLAFHFFLHWGVICYFLGFVILCSHAVTTLMQIFCAARMRNFVSGFSFLLCSLIYDRFYLLFKF